MKKLLTITMLLMLSCFAHAQKDVTRFLGIPVDGSKSEMIENLKAKGFKNSPTNDVLTGEFNGANVTVHIVTNNNKVYRIMVADNITVGERAIRIRFNRLCEQFANNSNYLALDDYTIPDDERISYETAMNDKRYEALFYQAPTVIDTVAVINYERSFLVPKYTEEQLANPNGELLSEIAKLAADYLIEDCSQRPVWFMISKASYGEFFISMFYDNEYNRANGEDL